MYSNLFQLVLVSTPTQKNTWSKFSALRKTETLPQCAKATEKKTFWVCLCCLFCYTVDTTKNSCACESDLCMWKLSHRWVKNYSLNLQPVSIFKILFVNDLNFERNFEGILTKVKRRKFEEWNFKFNFFSITTGLFGPLLGFFQYFKKKPFK